MWTGLHLSRRSGRTGLFRMPMEYNHSAQSVGMGGGLHSVGMEGLTLRYKDEDGKEQLEWFGYLSDEKQQDCRTSYCNSCKALRQLDLLDLLDR